MDSSSSGDSDYKQKQLKDKIKALDAAVEGKKSLDKYCLKSAVSGNKQSDKKEVKDENNLDTMKKQLIMMNSRNYNVKKNSLNSVASRAPN